MIEKLTTEQEELMNKVRDQWIAQLLDLKDVNEPQLLEGVEWLYKSAGLAVPKVIICDSILEAQLTVHFTNVVGSVLTSLSEDIKVSEATSVTEKIKNHVLENVSSTYRSISDNVNEDVVGILRENIQENVRGNVMTNIYRGVKDNVREKIKNHVSDSVYDTVSKSVSQNVDNDVEDTLIENNQDIVIGSIYRNVRENVEGNVAEEIKNYCVDDIYNSSYKASNSNVNEVVEDILRENIKYNVADNVMTNIYSNVRDNIQKNVIESIYDTVSKNVSENVLFNIHANARQSIGDDVVSIILENIFIGVKNNVEETLKDIVSSKIMLDVSNTKQKIENSVIEDVRFDIRANAYRNIKEDVVPIILGSIANSVSDSVRENVKETIMKYIHDSVRWDRFESIDQVVKNIVRRNVSNKVSEESSDNIALNVNWNVEKTIRKNVVNTLMRDVREEIMDAVINIDKPIMRDTIVETVDPNIEYRVSLVVESEVTYDNMNDILWDIAEEAVHNSVLQYTLENHNLEEFKYTPMCMYGDISDYGWVSYNDFFVQAGIVESKEFSSFVSLLQSNYYTMIQLEGLCVVVKNPLHILLNANKQMNSTKDFAIKFRDGWGMYFVNGFYLSDELFNKLSNKSFTPIEFFEEDNQEVKAACISFMQQEYGDEYIYEFFKSVMQEVDSYVHHKEAIYLKGTNTNVNVGVYTLFKGEINDTIISYVRCYDYSTDRIFFLGVDPVHNNVKDAVASLYKIPTGLKPFIQTINRQGERYSTTLTEEGNDLLKTLDKNSIADLTSVSGEEYFKLIKYEF